MAWGGAQRLGEIAAARFSQRNALLVTDEGLIKSGLIGPIAENLRQVGFKITIFDRSLQIRRRLSLIIVLMRQEQRKLIL